MAMKPATVVGGHARVTPERRNRDIGPPNGVERRVAARRATDAIKMGCPFCGTSESSVARSWGAIQADQVRRRRECANPACIDEAGKRRRYPTFERVDYTDPDLQRELAALGIAADPSDSTAA
jgi:hypothetical protein